MWAAIAFGLAAGAGFQAWRNYPAERTPTADAMLLVFLAGLLAAYLAGRGRRRWGAQASATAVASAEADATATSDATASQALQVNIWQPNPTNSRPVESGIAVPDPERLNWIAHRQQLSHDDVEGMDLSELLEAEPTEQETDG